MVFCLKFRLKSRNLLPKNSANLRSEMRHFRLRSRESVRSPQKNRGSVFERRCYAVISESAAARRSRGSDEVFRESAMTSSSVRVRLAGKYAPSSS